MICVLNKKCTFLMMLMQMEAHQMNRLTRRFDQRRNFFFMVDLRFFGRLPAVFLFLPPP